MFREVAYRAFGALSRVAVAGGLAPGGLRVLAYHGVPDESSLHRQLSWVRKHFTLVSLDEALEQLHSGQTYDDTILVTFDDGDPSVVERGLPVLDALGVYAVMFVCPGVIETGEPYWWQILLAAADLGLELEGQPVETLDVLRSKSLSDGDRREFVRRVRLRLPEHEGFVTEMSQISADDLRVWVDAGQSVGNHTWDHPILDKCDSAEQRRQIESAHEWLGERRLMQTRVFAYPNGNWSDDSDNVLRELGYAGAMLFDHRINRDRDPMRISRIRVNVDEADHEFVSRVSGLHPMFHALAHRS